MILARSRFSCESWQLTKMPGVSLGDAARLLLPALLSHLHSRFWSYNRDSKHNVSICVAETQGKLKANVSARGPWSSFRTTLRVHPETLEDCGNHRTFGIVSKVPEFL